MRYLTSITRQLFLRSTRVFARIKGDKTRFLTRRTSDLLSLYAYLLIRYNGLKVECLLTLAIWSYGHEAEEYIFLNLPFPSNPKEILQFAVFWVPLSKICYDVLSAVPPTHFTTL